jgi:ClpA/ClpB-like protein
MAGTPDLFALAERAQRSPDPGESLRAVVALREQIEELELDRVERAVEEGWSWGAIAESLGISRQAAHKRFAKRVCLDGRPKRRRRRRGSDLARPAQDHIVVTAEARRAVRAAQIAALALGHAEVEGAHLLLGLIADCGGAAGRALAAIGVDFDATRDRVAELDLPRCRLNGNELNASVAGRIPISRPARAALEQSLREAERLGHRHLGVEHVLLSLLRDPDGTAVKTLAAAGVEPEDLERCLGKVLKEADFDNRG